MPNTTARKRRAPQAHRNSSATYTQWSRQWKAFGNQLSMKERFVLNPNDPSQAIGINAITLNITPPALGGTVPYSRIGLELRHELRKQCESCGFVKRYLLEHSRSKIIVLKLFFPRILTSAQSQHATENLIASMAQECIGELIDRYTTKDGKY